MTLKHISLVEIFGNGLHIYKLNIQVAKCCISELLHV